MGMIGICQITRIITRRINTVKQRINLVRHILLALTLAVAAPAVAFAGSFNIGEEGGVTVEIPDDWSPNTYDGGVDANSPNGTYVFVEATEMTDLTATVDEGMKFFEEKGVELNKDSAKKQDIQINGMPAFVIEWTGKDKEGDASIALAAIGIDEKNAVLVMTWSDPETEKKDQEAFMGIVNSIKKGE